MNSLYNLGRDPESISETELDTNPSLTLAQTRTLSIGEWGGIQSLYQNSIWDENSQLHEIDA